MSDGESGTDVHRNAAIAALSTRDYRTAGDRYTRAAWRALADPREGKATAVDPFDADEQGWVGVGLAHLVVSAVCYRVADLGDRATRRGVEGVAVARDLEDALDRPVQRACLREFVADFRLVGDLDGARESYDVAAEAYRDAAGGGDAGSGAEADADAGAADPIGDPRRWATTALFEAAAAPIGQVARSTADGEIAVGWEELHGPDPADPGGFLARRATSKRQRFPGLLARVVDGGFLAAPRGTTEYATDHHRCPDCGSTDVNWVGERALCLRCSQPTEPQ